MTIDLQYLLLLQDLRNATGGAFNEFFNAISKFTVDIMPFLPYIVFWAVDKKWGYRYITTIWLGEIINGVIKLTVCAYRPWIRSPQIEPAGDSKVAATGYSFPSGHTMVGTVTYGTTTVWQWHKRRWLGILCIVMIALTAFSRNFLGVHTPQDVIVGFFESVILILIVGIVQEKVSGSEKMADLLTLAGIVLTAAVLVYIQVKPYPMDYVNGVLLVDPNEMMNDTFKGTGAFLGFLAGSYVERHYIHYQIDFTAKCLPLMTCIGAAAMFSWKELFAGATIVQAMGPHWGNFTARCLMVLFAMIVWPLCINKAIEAEKSKDIREA